MDKTNETTTPNLFSGVDAVETYRAEAYALPAEKVFKKFELPIRVFIDESTELARRTNEYYPTEGSRPGFETVSFRIPPETPIRTEGLAVAAREAHLQAVLGKSRHTGTLAPDYEQGEVVLRTIKRTLEFYYDDGIETPEDKELAALADEHTNTASVDGLSAALYDYGRMAQRDDEVLKQIQTWDPTLPQKALELHSKLAGPAPQIDKTALDLRNRFLTLLGQETRKIRTAAQFLFGGNHTDIYRKNFASAYLKTRRAEAARAKAKAAGTL